MKKGTCLRTPTAYFPPAHWIKTAADSPAWVLEGAENYQKGGHRNRCYIVGPNGPQTLSVPLAKGKHRAQPIREVRISYEQDWWRAHEQSIRTAYGRAPFFDYYAEELFTVARQRHPTLWELNYALLEKSLQLLRAPITLKVAEDFVRPGTQGYAWPADIGNGLTAYQQVFTDRHGFVPGLSILDALFCLGPEVLVR